MLNIILTFLHTSKVVDYVVDVHTGADPEIVQGGWLLALNYAGARWMAV